jgi:formamidopyrimidine-DNA glycosylase
MVGAEFPGTRVLRSPIPDLASKTIRKVLRHGKFILLELEGGFLAIHLGMTGRLLLGGSRGPYTRAIFTLDRGALLFDDIRQFGSIRWARHAPDGLGPDPLTVSFSNFAALLHARRGAIKPLLLNQGFVRGLGNIYADEILFRARIHPRALAARLSKQRIKGLHRAMLEVLAQAISTGGSSVSNYVDANGRKGTFQFLHQVYRKTGQPCPVCGTPIRRIVIAQRGTHYCPKCQRA